MCFTNPGLKTCALSRPRSLVSVPLRLAIAELARGWPCSHPPHTANRPLPAQGLISTPAPDLSFPRCPLPMRAGIALGRLGFRFAQPARIVPESPDASWAPRLRPLAHFCAILGSLAATHSVPEICTAAGNSVKSSGIKSRQRRPGRDGADESRPLALALALAPDLNPLELNPHPTLFAL